MEVNKENRNISKQKLLIGLILLSITISSYPQAASIQNWQIRQTNNIKTFTPPNLPRGKKYNITLYGARSLNNTTQTSLLKQFIIRNEKSFGKLIYKGKFTQYGRGIVGVARKYQSHGSRYNKTHRSYFALYMSLKIGNNKIRIFRAVYSDLKIYSRYKYAIKEVSNLMIAQGNRTYLKKPLAAHNKKKQRAASTQPKIINSKNRSAFEKRRKRTAKQEKEAAIQRALWTAPHKGLKSSDVEAILYYMNYTVGVFGPNVYYKNYLLLKDGWSYSSPRIPPTSFNVVVSRKLEPGKWKKWRKKGSSYQIRSKQGWHKLDGSRISPAKINQTLNVNLYSRTSWNLGGVAGGSSAKYLILKKNGRFETSSNSFNVGGYTSGNMVTSYSSKDKKGTLKIASGGLLSTKTKTTSGRRDRTGRYKLNGYTLELRHDSGRVSQLLFGFTYGNNKYLFVDGTNYTNKMYKK